MVRRLGVGNLARVGGPMKENQLPEVKAESLNLEVEEIEKRERGRPNCTSSTTSDFCTCLCRIPY